MASNKANKKRHSTETDLDPFLQNPSVYRRLIGRLSYLTMTRPDICFVVQTLSQFMSAPWKSHMEAATRVVRYLKGSPGMGIFLAATNRTNLECYVDSDWAACHDTRRSVTSFVLKFGGSPICWKSKK
ncbi:uncharacterized protein LOC114726966 [Neltuma alba]|uniref:uncharacterized protein LOC114726966 n=1 Tax=Neltuma alba TaxID=207710 RepID=UPI0010A44449|nr:uncharacterized protein LOC114726966 [Prosopis alba]